MSKKLCEHVTRNDLRNIENRFPIIRIDVETEIFIMKGKVFNDRYSIAIQGAEKQLITTNSVKYIVKCSICKEQYEANTETEILEAIGILETVNT